MAPDQARGEPLDPLADVFALGATLAVILTGKPAFVGPSVRETIDKAAAADLTDVFARLDGCGADAELIALAKRCLSDDRENRPADGRAVADEVAGYRAGVEARLKRAETDRARADTRRRVVQWAAGVVAAVLLAGVVGTSLGMFEAQRQTGVAQQQEAEAIRQKGIAEGETAKKEVALTERTEALGQAEERGQTLFAGLDAMTADIVGDSLATQKTVTDEQKKFLATVLPLYRKLAKETGNDRATRERVASAAFRVGLIENRVGRKEEGAEAFRQACKAFERLVADHSADPEYRHYLAISYINLGNLLSDLGKGVEAEGHYTNGLTLLEKLAADYPTVSNYRHHFARSHNNLGTLLSSLGKRGAAEGQYRKGLALQEQLVTDSPDVPNYRRGLAASHISLGRLLFELGKGAEAEGHCRKGLALGEKLAADFPAVPDYRSALAEKHNSLGSLLAGLERRAEAELLFRKGLALGEKLAADFPAVPDYRSALAGSHTNLGALLERQGKQAEAEVQYRKGLVLRETLAADFPIVPEYKVGLAGSYCNLGNLVSDGGKPADSLKWFEKAIVILLPVHEAEPRAVTAKLFLRNSHWGRARAYDRLEPVMHLTGC